MRGRLIRMSSQGQGRREPPPQPIVSQGDEFRPYWAITPQLLWWGSANPKNAREDSTKDEAAPNTIRRAGQIPPLPADLNRQQLTGEVPLAFRSRTDQTQPFREKVPKTFFERVGLSSLLPG
jgi:hypothetical protein